MNYLTIAASVASIISLAIVIGQVWKASSIKDEVINIKNELIGRLVSVAFAKHCSDIKKSLESSRNLIINPNYTGSKNQVDNELDKIHSTLEDVMYDISKVKGEKRENIKTLFQDCTRLIADYNSAPNQEEANNVAYEIYDKLSSLLEEVSDIADKPLKT